MLITAHTTDTAATPRHDLTEAAERDLDLRIAACTLVRKRFRGRAALEHRIEAARRGVQWARQWPQYADRCATYQAELDAALGRLEAAVGLADPLPPTAADRLASYVIAHGPIPTVRVSSAKARGAAAKYSYWGAARYEIRVGADGAPRNVALEGASSDRRSHRLVLQDAAELAEREGRQQLQTIGVLPESECEAILQAVQS